MTMSGFLLLLTKGNLAMGAAIVLVSLIRRPLRTQFGAPIAYAIWLLVPIATVASLLPPRVVPAPAHVVSANAPAPAPVTDYLPHSPLGEIEQVARHSVIAPLTPTKPLGSSYELFNTSWLLFAAWVLGLLFMAAYLTRVQIRFSAAVRRGQAGPAVLGLFRPRIVTPGDFQEQFTPQEQSAILAHESIHLARQDARINALVALLRCFCWFNPLVHLGARWLRIDQELACDAIAVSGAISRRDYSMALLKSQVMVGLLPFGCNWPGPQHPLVERIALLQRKPPGTARRLAGVSLILLTAGFAGLGAWAAQPPVTSKSMTAPQSGIAPTPLPAMLAAQDQPARHTGPGQPIASANPLGSGNDVDASKNAPSSRAISMAPVARTQAKSSPNPVTTTNAQGSAEQTLPPTTDSSTASFPTNQVAINQGAGQGFQINEATKSADPARRLPAAAPLPKTVPPSETAAASSDQPATGGQPPPNAAPVVALNDRDLSVGPVQPALSTTPATPAKSDSGQLHVKALISVPAMVGPSLGSQPRTRTETALACLLGMGKDGCETVFEGTDVPHRAPHSYTPHEASRLISYCTKEYVHEAIDRCPNGPLETVEYMGANTAGEDVYVAKFRHAQVTYIITPPSPDGKIPMFWTFRGSWAAVWASAKLQLQLQPPVLAPRLIYRR